MYVIEGKCKATQFSDIQSVFEPNVLLKGNYFINRNVVDRCHPRYHI